MVVKCAEYAVLYRVHCELSLSITFLVFVDSTTLLHVVYSCYECLLKTRFLKTSLLIHKMMYKDKF